MNQEDITVSYTPEIDVRKRRNLELPEWTFFNKDYIKGNLSYQLYANKELVVYAVVKPGDWLKIEVLEMHLSHRRHGYASQLLQSIIKEDSEATYILECDDLDVGSILNSAALNFWSKHGFVCFTNSTNGVVFIKAHLPLLICSRVLLMLRSCFMKNTRLPS